MRSREQLVDELAQVSHATWMRQAIRDKGEYPNTINRDVTDHDRERAEDLVQRLEQLGVVSWE